MVSLAEQPFGMFATQHEGDEFVRFSEQPSSGAPFTSPTVTTGPMDMTITADPMSAYPRSHHGSFSIPSTMGFEQHPVYAGASHFVLNGQSSPSLFPEDNEICMPSSSLSTASATSSAIGSPLSDPSHGAAAPEWSVHGLGVQPSIVSNEYVHGHGYSSMVGPHMEELAYDVSPSSKGFVDPSLIHPEVNVAIGAPHFDAHYQHPHQQQHYAASPSGSAASPQLNVLRTNSSSPSFYQPTNFPQHPYATATSPFAAPVDPNARRPSMTNYVSPQSGEYNSGDETKERQRCTYQDCGKLFKDLKAHMLTHQTERPEKCPIQTCEYHTKGFARKYDKNRHTLTHYKGNMVCGFCPGPGSVSEKSFNRADVFKRHLTAVHNVEQTPPNSRKKLPVGINSGKKVATYAAEDATGKCSTCTQTFANAQDFYEHLDDCVLRIVQREDPAEAVNEARLAEVENDPELRETLEKNRLPLSPHAEDGEGMEDMDVEDDSSPNSNNSGKSGKKTNPPGGVQKSRGMTHSRGGVSQPKNRGRKDRRGYPDSWGFHHTQMNLKKRVLAVFDGPRRLAKDDMMLATDHEVRIPLASGETYVTDLDIQSLKRAEGFLNATEEEKGPWLSDDPTEAQLLEMQQMQNAVFSQ